MIMARRTLAVIPAIAAICLFAACTPTQINAYLSLSPEQRAIVDPHVRQLHEESKADGSGLSDVSGHWFLSCVRAHESRGDYTAQNPSSTASGAYQFLDSTWRNVAPKAGFPGYSRAKYAPPRVQDHVALWLYNNGGKSAWNGTGC